MQILLSSLWIITALLSLSDRDGLRRELKKEKELELQNLEQEICYLSNTLPICSIRRDLKYHYDEFVLDSNQRRRCLIELLPRPLFGCSTNTNTNTNTNSITQKKKLLHAAASIQLGQVIRHLLTSNTNSLLIGISTFYRGNIVYTHTAADSCRYKEDTTAADDNDDVVYDISNVTATTIMRYMDYHQQQMQQHGILRLSPTQPPSAKKSYINNNK